MSVWKALGIAIGVGVAVGVAIAVIAYLSYDKFMQWFRDRLPWLQQKPGLAIRSQIQRHRQSGNYVVMQGVFNPVTKEVVDFNQQEVRNLDADILRAHDEDGFAVWTA